MKQNGDQVPEIVVNYLSDTSSPQDMNESEQANQMFKLFSTDAKLIKYKQFMHKFRDRFQDMTNMLIKYHETIKSQEKQI